MIFYQKVGLFLKKVPILSDFYSEAGSAKGHYFHQDLLVAQYIFNDNPVDHIDIGSRIDGFVAHVASYRAIKVLDVRELNSNGHPNIKFIQADLMNPLEEFEASHESISCLHAIEHFGLGRYGDPIDPFGHLKGFNNIVKMLKLEGVLYISFPIGMSTQVYFNAHRIFHPLEILSWPGSESLDLTNFDYIDDFGELRKNADPKRLVGTLNHGCGIYTFKKIKA